jgi:hypothetical protein
MRRWPQCPLQSDSGAGRGVGVEGSGRGAVDPTGRVSSALEVGERDVLDRTVALDRTRDAVGGRRGVGVRVRLVKLVEDTADGAVVHVAVSCDQGREGEGGDGGKELHFDRAS